jgi:hypothetical protein
MAAWYPFADFFLSRLDEGLHHRRAERAGAAGNHDMPILERLHFHSS